MIEVIINYIREQGFIVDVRERVLVIRKRIDGQLFSMSRAISEVELNAIDEYLAEWIAENWIEQFNAGVKQGGQQGA